MPWKENNLPLILLDSHWTSCAHSIIIIILFSRLANREYNSLSTLIWIHMLQFILIITKYFVFNSIQYKLKMIKICTNKLNPDLCFFKTYFILFVNRVLFSHWFSWYDGTDKSTLICITHSIFLRGNTCIHNIEIKSSCYQLKFKCLRFVKWVEFHKIKLIEMLFKCI